MAVTITHSFVSAIPDGLDATLVRSSNWNDLHAINMATSRLLGRSTAGTGAAEEISIGSGLSLTSGTLSASGGGGATLTISNKTGAYTVVAGDLGTIINCTSGTFTVSLTDAATLGAGFNCWVWNTGTGTVTIDPSGSETIEGVTTATLAPGQGYSIVCTGTAFIAGDQKALRLYAEKSDNGFVLSPTASGTGSVAIGAQSTASAAYAAAIRGNVSVAYGTAIGANSSAQRAQAATGSGAMALGGSYASGTDSFAAAVANNTSTYGAKGANSVALGLTTLATGGESVSLGSNCLASSTWSFAFGAYSEATRAGAVAVGLYALSSISGKYVYSGGRFASTGDAQTGTFAFRQETTNATATVLTTNNAAASTTNQIILPNNSAYAFTGTIVARRKASEGTQTAAWRVEGLIRREGTAASTVLVNSALTVIDNTPGWSIALSADTTNGGLAVTATGAAATNIRWVATLQTSEVTYA